MPKISQLISYFSFSSPGKHDCNQPTLALLAQIFLFICPLLLLPYSARSSPFFVEPFEKLVFTFTSAYGQIFIDAFLFGHRVRF